MIAFLEEYLVYILLIAAVILMLRIFTLPIRLFFRLLWNAIVGLVLLVIFNALGGLIGINIGVNLLTCLTAGILGIPGIILLLLIKWLGLL